MNIQQILGLPGILDVKKIVVIQPHPDDNEVGAAGTLIELAKRGCHIVYVTVTDGRAGAPDENTQPDALVETRKREKEAAGVIVGVAKQIDLGFQDAGSFTVEEVVTKLMPIVRQEQPDMVMSVDPWMPYESHPDHIKTGKAVTQAVLFANNHVLYKESGDPVSIPQVALYGTSYPNTFVDVTKHWEAKMASILAHDSQFNNAKWPMLSMYFQYQANELFKQWQKSQAGAAASSTPLDTGSNSAVKAETSQDEAAPGYAEAFKVLTSHQLHFFPSALYS